MKGGFQQIIDALEKSIESKGGGFRKKTTVSGVSYQNGVWQINGTRYDAIISTIPPPELERVGVRHFQCSLSGGCMHDTCHERDVTSGIYWLNMKDPAPYGAVVTHTNFIPPDRYGEHIVYLASYSPDVPPNLDARCLRISVRVFP